MGAMEFSVFVRKDDFTTTTEQAFRQAVSEAQFESGHGGYTGTIAEKQHFALVRKDAVTARQAQRIAQELFDGEDERVADKWGPAAALVVEDENKSGWLFFGIASY